MTSHPRDLFDDPFARAVADLRALAEGDLAPAEAELRARRLARSPALAELLELARQGALAEALEEDEEPAEAWLAPPGEPHRQVRPFRPPSFEEIVGTVREGALAEAVEAVESLFERRAGRGPIALVADGGSARERADALERLARDLRDRTGHGLHEVDARADPFLEGLANGLPPGRAVRRQAETPAAILDGDLAPDLVGRIRDGHYAAYLVLAPTASLRSLGQQLEPELVVSVSSARVPMRPAEPLRFEPLDLIEALELRVNGDGQAVELPRGEPLVALLRRLAQAPQAGAKEVLQVFRRLAVGERPAEARQALTDIAAGLLDRFPPAAAHHALAWAGLYRDLGLHAYARAVLVKGYAELRSDVRVRHALALAELAVGETTDGLRRLEELAGDPARRTAHVVHALARAYRRQGQLQPALAVLEQGPDGERDNVYLLVEEARVRTLLALTGGGTDPAGERLRQLARADGLFRRARRAAPRSGVILNAWARAASWSGRPYRAEALLARAVELEPWNDRHRLEQAQFAKERGLLDEAEQQLAGLVELPGPVERRRALVLLADTLIEAGPSRWDEADELLDELGKALWSDPGAGPDDRARLDGARLKLALARAEFHRAEVDRTASEAEKERLARAARAELDRADRLEREAESRRYQPAQRRYLLAQRIQLALAQGYLEGAARHLDELKAAAATTDDPETAEVHVSLLARYYASRGNWDRAREGLEVALRQRGERPHLLNTLAELERQVAERPEIDPVERGAALERAETLHRRALGVDPLNAYTHRALAALLRARWSHWPAEASRLESYARLAGLPVEGER